MLGLPIATEIHKVIPKKKVFEHFGSEMSLERRKSFDADIARITVVNEVSPATVNIPAGESVQGFFVVLATLRKKDFDKQNAAFIAKMLGQKLLLVLEYDEKQALAIWQTRLILKDWADAGQYQVSITGLDLDKVWENIVAEAAGIEVAQGRTLNEQLDAQQKRQKLEKEIAKLEKLTWAEKQPKRKMELSKKANHLKQEMEALYQ